MNKHLIVLPGVPNPRDLGGFPVGARHVKKDILIRSCVIALTARTERDWQR